jgi:branched-chain amino acid transport system substrate-binding protein
MKSICILNIFKGGLTMFKSKLFKSIMVVVIISMFLLVISGCTQPEPTPSTQPSQAPKYIKVGLIFGITGPIGTIAVATVRGAELYFDKVNKDGGIKIGDDTYLFQTVVEDDKLNPEVAATAAKKLILQDKVDFVMGTIFLDPVTQAVYEVCEANNVLQISPYITAPHCPADISSTKPYSILLNVPADAAFGVDYNYLLELYPDVKRIVIVHPDIGYEGLVEKIKSIASSHNLEIVGIVPFEFGVTEDFTPIITRALANNPDAFHSLNSAQSQYQLKTLREMGFKGPFWADAPMGPDVFQAVAGESACTDMFCNGWDPTRPTDAMQEVIEAWEANYADPFVSDALVTWDASRMFVQILQKAQSLEAEKIVATMENLTSPGSLQSAYGPANTGGFDEYGVNRLIVRPIVVSRLMDGEIISVDYFVPE